MKDDETNNHKITDMKTKLYQLPQCEVLEMDHLAVLCASLDYGAETESFNEFVDLEMN
jgi:nitrate reductase NapAB chaperone NapD